MANETGTTLTDMIGNAFIALRKKLSTETFALITVSLSPKGLMSLRKEDQGKGHIFSPDGVKFQFMGFPVIIDSEQSEPYIINNPQGRAIKALTQRDGEPVKNAFLAMRTAYQVHHRHTRKFTGLPYVDHLAAVAGMVAAIESRYRDAAIAVAWLHDTVEDHQYSESAIRAQFGEAIAAGVMLLTDVETGSRAERLLKTCSRLALAPSWVQSVKLADVINNVGSLATANTDFAQRYLPEKMAVVLALKDADPGLRILAGEVISNVAMQIGLDLTEWSKQSYGTL